jgi:hypothetical protein
MPLLVGKRHKRALRTNDVDRFREPAGSDQARWSRSQAQPAFGGLRSNTLVKDVGEPCAGEPHDRRGWLALAARCRYLVVGRYAQIPTTLGEVLDSEGICPNDRWCW